MGGRTQHAHTRAHIQQIIVQKTFLCSRHLMNKPLKKNYSKKNSTGIIQEGKGSPPDDPPPVLSRCESHRKTLHPLWALSTARRGGVVGLGRCGDIFQRPHPFPFASQDTRHNTPPLTQAPVHAPAHITKVTVPFRSARKVHWHALKLSCRFCLAAPATRKVILSLSAHTPQKHTGVWCVVVCVAFLVYYCTGAFRYIHPTLPRFFLLLKLDTSPTSILLITTNLFLHLITSLFYSTLATILTCLFLFADIVSSHLLRLPTLLACPPVRLLPKNYCIYTSKPTTILLSSTLLPASSPLPPRVYVPSFLPSAFKPDTVQTKKKTTNFLQYLLLPKDQNHHHHHHHHHVVRSLGSRILPDLR